MNYRVASELSTSCESRLGEIAGFLRGDGCVEKEPGNGVSFANAEPSVIKHILADFREVFGLEIPAFNFYLTIGENCPEEKTARFWKGLLGLSDMRVYYDKRSKKPHGWMKVHFSDKDVKKKILFTIKNVEHASEKDERILAGFIRGFFAAEGAVIPGKKHKEVPNSIQLPQKGKSLPNRIREILAMLGITGRVVLKHKKADYYCVNITAFENFEKFLKLGLADMHPEKRKKIEIGLSSYKSRPSRKNVVSSKLLRLIEGGAKTRHEIYAAMDRSKQQVNMMLYSKGSCLKKKNLIRKEIGEDGVPRWSITRSGKCFLRSIEADEQSF